MFTEEKFPWLNTLLCLVGIIGVFVSLIGYFNAQDQRIALSSERIQVLEQNQATLEKRLDTQNQLQDQNLQHYEDNIDNRFARVFENQKEILEQMVKK